MFKGKKVIVLGAGISGQGAARTLLEQGAEVTLYDQKKIDLPEEFASSGVSYIQELPDLGLVEGFALAVISPGISINSAIVETLKERGTEVIGEVELAACLYKGEIIAVTGTNGKTTTTTLVAEMVKTLTKPCATGGNIGESLSLLAAHLPEKSILTAEVSSFQLESIKSFNPHIAAILNITPDHLDRHVDMNGYIAVKSEVFKNQDKDDYLILNYDDKSVRAFAEQAKSQICFFSSSKELPEGAFVRSGTVCLKWKGKEHEIVKIEEMKIFGLHNVENALAACACAYFAGVSLENMRKVLRNFEGVEHRIEYTRTINGVKYYNDSKATNPESAIKALEAFPKNVILIAGGYDKLTDLSEFMTIIKKKTDALILLGKAKDRFASEAKRLGVENILLADSFEAAVEKAHEIAKEPQVVLLSPACSSYDMFNNFEERGRYFKELVNKF